MNCEQVQSLLVAYLDGEVTPSERALIRAHLSGCTACQQEIALLSTARSRVRSVLQRRAAHAAPSREAWSRLEARLPKVQVPFLQKEAQPSSSKFAAWFSRMALSESRASNQLLGGVTMQKRWVLSALAGVVVLSVLAVLVAKNFTTVSARQILDRAYQAQSQEVETQGIQHISSEIYSNIEALPEDQGMDTTVESYFDLESGKSRLVVTDHGTGRVIQAYAYDGSNVYSSQSAKGDIQSDEPLTIYRSPQKQPGGVAEKLQQRYAGVDKLGAKTMFDKMRSDPDVQFVGEETWEDGRTVYVLRSEQPIKVLVKDEMQHPTGLVSVYFDVDTYKLVGSRVTMEKDGEEILISFQHILVDETLPAESNVAWDLSDLQGVSIVDDPNSEHAVPEVITVEELKSKTQSAYLLKTIPDGFSLEVSVLPKQPDNEQFFYNATYTKGEDYFTIRTWGDKIEDASWADENYTTANGLVLHFVVEAGVTSTGGQITSALVETPEGMTFAINSTLPREEIKALVEDLVLVSK
jgi:Putative zinc-finger